MAAAPTCTPLRNSRGRGLLRPRRAYALIAIRLLAGVEEIVMFTGRWPRGAFDYLVGTVRWVYRVVAYCHLMTDVYPPFSLADDPDYRVRLNIDYPEQVANWRPPAQWLLAIPYLLIAGVLYWPAGVLTIVAFFTVIFTKQIPRGVFELMVPGLRWNLRGNA